MVPSEPADIDSNNVTSSRRRDASNRVSQTRQQKLDGFLHTQDQNTYNGTDRSGCCSGRDTLSQVVLACDQRQCNNLALTNQSVQLRIDDELADADENLHFGSELLSPKPPETLRLYFQNANSIRSERMEKWLHACVCMRAKEVDIFGLAEINVNPRHPGLTEEIAQIAKRNWTHATTTLANTDADCRAWAQQGGTCMTTTRKWISRLVESGRDAKLGRWSYHILRGQDNRKTVFVSGYRVCQANVAGPLTAASQQWSILKKAGVDRPNPRKQFFSDLSVQVKKWTSKNWEVCVSLDANEAHEDKEHGLASFLEQTSLIDVHRYFHGSEHEPATYNQGSRKIDHVLCTQGFVDCVSSCGIEVFGVGLESDHRGLFVDVDATKLFGDCTPNLSHHSSRILDSHIPFYVQKYRRELHQQFSDHNIYDRVLRLSKIQGPPTLDDIDEYEAADCDITNACLSAERKLGNPKVVPWSPELLTRVGTLYYWKKLQSLKSTKKKIPK